jgi:Ni/Fe-hydrogenase subunit HybB-like protein
LMIAGIPLSAATAVYTAYLFAQAKARDMWQNPLLPPHLFFQAILLGSAVLLSLVILLFGTMTSHGIVNLVRSDVYWLTWVLGITSLIHLLMVWGEVSLTHPTSHARLAIWEMVKGRYRTAFWTGTLFSVIGGLLPLLVNLNVLETWLAFPGAVFALIGMLLFEHAYVQAGQSVPLA